ncbi:hypothetical protein [Paenibacillus sp. PL2-23]|uniref:hypothetical protein n=1 Tax=Paenibacillus sp. PL2-23 TaxID=2100729 RepID=UPI0030F5FFB5
MNKPRLGFILSMTFLYLTACSNNDSLTNPTISPNHSIDSTAPTSDITSGYLKYESNDGWSIQYPKLWDQLSDTTLSETSTGKYLSIRKFDIPEDGTEEWVNSEIERTLSFEEASNILLEDVTKETIEGASLYRYSIQSTYQKDSITVFKNAVYVYDHHIYKLHAAVPPLSNEEFEQMITSFTIKEK